MASTLADLLRLSTARSLLDVHVSMPGRIESYDAAKQEASVQPLIKVALADGSEASLPVINQVPVIWPRGGGAILSFPLQAGDTVLLVFSERSLDEWLQQGGELAPDDPRSHDLSDAVAIPGLYPFSEPGDADSRDALLRFRGGELRLSPDGKIQLKNQLSYLNLNPDGTVALGGADELLSIVDGLLDQLLAMVVVGPPGAGTPANLPAFAALKMRLATLKERS